MVAVTATPFQRFIVTAATLTALLLPAGGFSQDALYTLTDIGTFGGKRSAAHGINRAGHVVGSAETTDGRNHAFVYLDGALVDLGTFGGDESYAYRISDGALIVGRASTKDGEFRPFVSAATGVPIDLSQLDGRLKGTFSTVVDVNSAGHLVGYRQTHKDHMAARRRVFVVRNFGITDIGTFGGEDGAVAAVNNVGQMAGYFSTEPHADYADHRAFVLDGRGLTHLGSLGGRMTTPTDLNDSGHVVGYAQITSGENHAFLYRAGKLMDLGTLPGGTQSHAYAINNLGQVVGTSDASGGGRFAVIFDGNALRDLNGLIPAGTGWLLTEARDINDSGQIVGSGIVDGQTRAFLLTPTGRRKYEACQTPPDKMG